MSDPETAPTGNTPADLAAAAAPPAKRPRSGDGKATSVHGRTPQAEETTQQRHRDAAPSGAPPAAPFKPSRFAAAARGRARGLPAAVLPSGRTPATPPQGAAIEMDLQSSEESDNAEDAAAVRQATCLTWRAAECIQYTTDVHTRLKAYEANPDAMPRAERLTLPQLIDLFQRIPEEVRKILQLEETYAMLQTKERVPGKANVLKLLKRLLDASMKVEAMHAQTARGKVAAPPVVPRGNEVRRRVPCTLVPP